MQFTPVEITNIMNQANVAVASTTADERTLGGWYSELMRASRSSSLSGDQRAALIDGANKLMAHRKQLNDANGTLAQFNNAQKNFNQTYNTFRNDDPIGTGGSPVAHALNAIDPTQTPRPLRGSQIQKILTNQENHEIASKALERYRGMGHDQVIDAINLMKDNADIAEGEKPRKAGVPSAADIRTELLSKQRTPTFQPTASRYGLMYRLPAFMTSHFFQTPQGRAWLVADPQFPNKLRALIESLGAAGLTTARGSTANADNNTPPWMQPPTSP
jgi:hypothetical protein